MDQFGRKRVTEFGPSGLIQFLQGFDFGGNNLALSAGATGQIFRQKLKRVKPPLLFQAGYRQ
jgi:hypothetical protein